MKYDIKDRMKTVLLPFIYALMTNIAIMLKFYTPSKFKELQIQIIVMSIVAIIGIAIEVRKLPFKILIYDTGFKMQTIICGLLLVIIPGSSIFQYEGIFENRTFMNYFSIFQLFTYIGYGVGIILIFKHIVKHIINRIQK